MKFLIHIPQLIYGGAEKVLVDFANYLVERGHNVEILETYEKGLLKHEFDSSITFDSICSKEFTEKYYVSLENLLSEKNIIQKIKKFIKKIFITVIGYERLAKIFANKKYKNKEYDVAINYLEIESPKFIIKSINAKKYLQWIHIDISKVSNIGFIDKQVKWYKKLDNIICVSNVSKESFNKRYIELRNKTSVIYNFYNVDKIKEMSKGNNVFNSNDFNILSVGRLVEQKGYERAINIFYRLKQDGYYFKWSIIGEGILRDKLEKKIKLLGLEKDIKLLGIKENPYPYIKQCDLFFLPSLYEGFPTVTIEAKILEKPVLATEVSGIREQIINNKTGLIIKNDDKEIYIALKEILSNKEIIKNIVSNSNLLNIISNYNKYEILINMINKS
ncbi:glycosyltransferase [Clostridium perfringens]|uniref:glycosyltransferase n=1 Tax=Clostridium perfringens TaxID=1502 RepID=UPI0018E448CA|nr:glycosyltransferase [Clostridium perfringens]MBI6091443.1 glycosyltransferase [Clostridium perfringens]MDM1000221.1 glycosyltransferase [Clostridium perfringens]UBL04247.1 glycosyltransferase [Clostridium perfringens]